MRLATILGARPQFIKAAPVSHALKEAGITEMLIHTGQHFDNNMSKVFFDEMQIPEPKYNLGVKASTHATMTGQMMIGIEEILLKESPDMVMVYGDTNSTLAGSLTARKLNIPLAHVEAGLRSFNMKMPEEINRIATDRISDFLFCPTDTAVMNLQKEGFDKSRQKIIKTGDVMFDALKRFIPIAEKNSKILDHLDLIPNEFILCTLHRQENTDVPHRMENLLGAIRELSQSTSIVIPVHPRTKKWFDSLSEFKNVRLIDPIGYLDMLILLKNCEMVLTDSGGLQKEAYFSGKFCLTARDETEWIELVDNGFNFICSADKEHIINQYDLLKKKRLPNFINFYGNGEASRQIALSLRS